MITLELTVEETNCILNALAYQPYKDVAELIVKIQNVGNEQIKELIGNETGDSESPLISERSE